MNISIEDAGQVKVLGFEGELDAGTAPEAQGEIDRLRAGGSSKIVIDFDRLSYISSAGLRVLMLTAKHLKDAGGELRVCGLNKTVGEVFDMSGFSTILNVFGDREEALADF